MGGTENTENFNFFFVCYEYLYLLQDSHTVREFSALIFFSVLSVSSVVKGLTAS
jgi:hypothetical protein